MANHANDMTAMPGNDHAAELKAHQGRGNDLAPSARATLALAFEQRTLALIAYAQVADDETADRLWVDHITPRLGLDAARRMTGATP